MIFMGLALVHFQKYWLLFKYVGNRKMRKNSPAGLFLRHIYNLVWRIHLQLSWHSRNSRNWCPTGSLDSKRDNLSSIYRVIEIIMCNVKLSTGTGALYINRIVLCVARHPHRTGMNLQFFWAFQVKNLRFIFFKWVLFSSIPYFLK